MDASLECLSYCPYITFCNYPNKFRIGKKRIKQDTLRIKLYQFILYFQKLLLPPAPLLRTWLRVHTLNALFSFHTIKL